MDFYRRRSLLFKFHRPPSRRKRVLEEALDGESKYDGLIKRVLARRYLVKNYVQKVIREGCSRISPVDHPWEGDGVSYVVQPADPHHESLHPQSESRVRD